MTDQCYTKCDLQTAARATLGRQGMCQKYQFSHITLDLLNQNYWWLGPKYLCFNKPSMWFLCLLKCGQNCCRLLGRNPALSICGLAIFLNPFRSILLRAHSAMFKKLICIVNITSILWGLIHRRHQEMDVRVVSLRCLFFPNVLPTKSRTNVFL